MASDQTLNVLFLCTHNSARSILAEALLNHLGQGRFRAYSAGSGPQPDQRPHPLALEALRNAGISTQGLHSKHWDTFARADAPHMHLVVTVCDNAAGESCPYWPGQPATAHWGFADPSGVEGTLTQKQAAFSQTPHAIRERIAPWVKLPPASPGRAALEDLARELARSDAP